MPRLAGQHPGFYLRTLIARRHLTQEAVAEMLGVNRVNLNQLLNGHRRITPNMALRLDRHFSPTALWWLRRQTDYDLRIERESFYEG